MEIFEKTSFNRTIGIGDTIFSAINDPAIIYDVYSNVAQVNLSFIERYGCNPVGVNVRELIKMFSCRWLDESQYLFDQQPTVRALKGERTSGHIFSILHDGVEQYVETSSSPLYDNGNIIGALTIWHTLDNHEKIKEALSHRQELNRRIDDFAPCGVIISKNGSIQYANTPALKILGAKHLLDIEGKTAYDFFDARFEKQITRRIENLNSGKIIDELEQTIIRIDGEHRDVEIKAINISDANDKIIKVYLRDISSQKKINYYNTILSNIEQVIQSSVNNVQICKKAMEMVAKAFDCDSADVAFLKNSQWEVKHMHKSDESLRDLIIPEEEISHAQIALHEKKIIFIEDAYTDPRVNNEKLKSLCIRSVIVVPLFTRQERIGVLIFNYRNNKRFNHEEIYFLIRFSSALSLALENSELFDNLQHELFLKEKNEKRLIKLNNTLLALSRSSQAMVHATSEREYVSQICHIITSDCNQALAWVGFPEGKKIIPRIWSGEAKEYLKTLKIKTDNSQYSRGPTGLAYKKKQVFVCNNISEDPDFAPWRKHALAYNLNSTISLPLIHQDKVFGMLNIYSKEVNFYTDDEIMLLTELAKYLAHGIFSIRLNIAKKQTEEALLESEERFRMITEKSNALICELDISGRVLYANAQYLDIFGWQQPFSDSILDNCQPEDKTNFYNYIYNPEIKISKTEWALKDKNNNWRWFRCHPGIFKTSRGGKHFSLVLFDISESKISEQQLKQNAKELKELNATKDKFFTIIAHDLKNPFTSLMGASELLSSATSYEAETVQRLGKMINESARRGFNLLQNLLDWSRAQTGTISFDPRKIILNDLVKECWDSVKTSAYNKGHKIEIAVPDCIEVHGDYNMLNTVIRNLMQNAIKFTHEHGYIKIQANKNKSGVIVSIEDNGTGLSSENLKKLFRMDIKFTNPGTNREMGTGLGLHLCKEFVEKHGGKIWVRSAEGEGSKFSFSIPHLIP